MMYYLFYMLQFYSVKGFDNIRDNNDSLALKPRRGQFAFFSNFTNRGCLRNGSYRSTFAKKITKTEKAGKMTKLSYSIAKDCVQFVSEMHSLSSMASSIRAKLPGKNILEQKQYLRDNVKATFAKLMSEKAKLSPTSLEYNWELLYEHIFGTHEQKTMLRK